MIVWSIADLPEVLEGQLLRIHQAVHALLCGRGRIHFKPQEAALPCPSNLQTTYDGGTIANIAHRQFKPYRWQGSNPLDFHGLDDRLRQKEPNAPSGRKTEAAMVIGELALEPRSLLPSVIAAGTQPPADKMKTYGPTEVITASARRFEEGR